MYHDRITLSGQEIYEVEFKVDARGYNMQEVDKLLDIVIRDYGQGFSKEDLKQLIKGDFPATIKKYAGECLKLMERLKPAI